MHVLGMVLLVLLGWASGAEAACSGSGLVWSCTAGSTVANVNSAITSASDGATITFAAGSYSWTGGAIQLNNLGAKGMTFICATVRGCTATYGSSGVFYMDSIPGNPNLIRISGFIFSGSPGTAAIWLYGAGNVAKLRIDNNTFQGQATSTITILLGELSSNARFYGVIDHNIFTGSTNFMALKNISGGGWPQWQVNQQGTGNAMFFEDNQCTFTSYPDTGTGCVDEWRASSTVLRFNTVTNSRFVNHSYCHDGPYNSEVYGNIVNNAAFSGAPNYRNIHFQGSGEITSWGNQVEINSGGNTMVVQNFRDDVGAGGEGSCVNQCDGTRTGTGTGPGSPNDGNRSPTTTYRGYPCQCQPGRDKNYTLKPLYIWRNRNAAGTKVDLLIDGGQYETEHLQYNRDVYNAVSANAQTSPTSPFNGTTGMGYGTLANRPTTCTPTPEALDAGQGGVGYWATDQGTWKTATPSQGVDVDNGVLYACSATNTWTVHYTPYTYPHPLVSGSGGGGGGDTTPPNAPTNLRVQ